MINYLLNLKLVNDNGSSQLIYSSLGAQQPTKVCQYVHNSQIRCTKFSSSRAQPKQRHIVGWERQQKADFHRDAVEYGNCSRLDDRASDDIEVFIMAR
jgi:hypothetical protein